MRVPITRPTSTLPFDIAKYEQPKTADAYALSRLRQAIIENTQGDLFWIGEILLSELEKETGFKG